MKRLNTNEYIQKAKEVHGDTYAYKKTVFTGMRQHLIVTCKEHGDFKQNAWSHISGRGCRKCASKSRRINTEAFIEKAKKKHGDKYNYDKVEYFHCYKKVKIFCNTDKKYFYQAPSNHLHGQGCPICGRRKTHTSTDLFIQKARIMHKDRYDYSQTKYTGSQNKVIIICKKHGKFKQIANSHLAGKGCRKCWIDKITIHR